ATSDGGGRADPTSGRRWPLRARAHARSECARARARGRLALRPAERALLMAGNKAKAKAAPKGRAAYPSAEAVKAAAANVVAKVRSTDLLRLATAGSVDDGKSTLIGRLLFDSKTLFIDQLAAVERVSRERGHDFTDLALLTDGLRAEREQGITIDVAYRFFATP